MRFWRGAASPSPPARSGERRKFPYRGRGAQASEGYSCIRPLCRQIAYMSLLVLTYCMVYILAAVCDWGGGQIHGLFPLTVSWGYMSPVPLVQIPMVNITVVYRK